MFDMIPFKKNNRELNNIFNDLEKGFLKTFYENDIFSLNTIKADMQESDKEYVIEAELPGFEKEDIAIEILDYQLIISAKRDESFEEQKDEEYMRRERCVKQVSRSFILNNVKQDEIKAQYKNGILKVNLPKTKGKQWKSTRINIE